MAITADLETAEGIPIAGAVLKVRDCAVKQFDEEGTEGDPDYVAKGAQMTYGVDVWANATSRDDGKRPVSMPHWDRFKITPAPTTDAVVAAYGDLKTRLEADLDVTNVVDDI
jgi:hypothetical protein